MYKMKIIINTWRTKRTPWLIKIYDPTQPTLDTMPDYDFNEINELIDLIKTSPTRVSTPERFSILSLPRYYLIVINDGIVDIIGIRRDKIMTKWSYRLGYWHPLCQDIIIKCLSSARYLC